MNKLNPFQPNSPSKEVLFQEIRTLSEICKNNVSELYNIKEVLSYKPKLTKILACLEDEIYQFYYKVTDVSNLYTFLKVYDLVEFLTAEEDFDILRERLEEYNFQFFTDKTKDSAKNTISSLNKLVQKLIELNPILLEEADDDFMFDDEDL